MATTGSGVNLNKFLSRKFTIAVVSITISSLLVLFDKIADGVYSTIMVCTVGAYLAANIVQKKDEK